ncbi:hypothetical protein BJX62DRAFT_239493 [Aspergillus germanicus]
MANDIIHHRNRLRVLVSLKTLLDSLGIKSEQLVLKSDGSHTAGRHFFKPHPVNWIARHPPDPTDEYERRGVDRLRRVWLRHDRERNDDEHGAEVIATCLNTEFLTLLRLPAGSGALQKLSGWAEGQVLSGTIKSPFMSPQVLAAGPDESPLAPWALDIHTAWYRRDKQAPHVIATLVHQLAPDAQNLTRFELLIIIGIMRTRLELFEDHEIAPVMVISCFHGTRARVVQAHYDNDQLFIHKSDLTPLNSPEARQRNIPILLAYLSSQPTGDTRHIVSQAEK